MNTLGLVIALVLALPRMAMADEAELQFSVAPSMTFLERHGHLNRGIGGGVKGSLGVFDWLSVGGAVGCDRLDAIADTDSRHGSDTGHLVYDTTRCAAGPWFTLRTGTQIVGQLGAGIAYRFEAQSSRDFVSSNDVLLEHLENSSAHQLVAIPRAAIEYRPWDRFSATAFVESTLALIGATTELDLSAGIAISLYLYP